MICYPYILGILDTINEWNEKIKAFATSNSNNVAFATAFIIGIFVVAAWAINMFYKK